APQLLCHNYRQKFQQFRNNSRNLQRNLNTCRDDLLLSDIQIDIKWGDEVRRLSFLSSSGLSKLARFIQ
ncbi:12919_t:CDS:2, partial [Entrophospora sp. SA101]